MIARGFWVQFSLYYASRIIFELEPSHPILIASNNSSNNSYQQEANGASPGSRQTSDADKYQSNDSDENEAASHDNDFWNYANGSAIPDVDSDDESDGERDNAIILKNFNLNGDVIWHNLDKFDLQDCDMPFFYCCLFEYNKVSKKLRMSSASSLYFDFQVEYIRNEANNETIMMLKTENMISLKCRRVRIHHYRLDLSST